jgi:nucleotide-binding universal stress UspA family protein
MNIVTRTEIVHSDDVVRSVCQSAERLGADVICVASHGGSAIVQTLLGSVTEGVMKHSRVPVIVVQPLPR